MSLFSSLEGKIILGEDFNPRLGNKHKNYIITDTSNCLPIYNSITETDIHLSRNTQEEKTNSNGKHLAGLYMTNDLKIINGIKTDDLTGKYTCYQYNGSNAVDYMITKPKLFDKINHIPVVLFATYSDHCQMVKKVDIKPVNATNTSGKNYAKAPGQFKWEGNSGQKVNSYLRCHNFTKAIKILKQSLLSATSDIRMNTV